MSEVNKENVVTENESIPEEAMPDTEVNEIPENAENDDTPIADSGARLAVIFDKSTIDSICDAIDRTPIVGGATAALIGDIYKILKAGSTVTIQVTP